MYNETLQTFVDEIEEKLKNLEDYKNIGNMKDYSILVHSIKSDCKYLGFRELADKCFEHEMKSKANDVAYIVEDFEKLKSLMEKFIKISREYLK